MLIVMFSLVAGAAVASTGLVPFEWRIENPFIIAPLLTMAVSHILFVFVLNRESLFENSARSRTLC